MNISLKAAETALAAAKTRAIETGVLVNIAILDGGGHLKAFARMDRSPLGSIDAALKKAKTAVLFGINSESVREYSKPGAPAQGLEMTNDVLVSFAGGIPFRDAEGEVIGAIGFSGGSVPQDYEVALAGHAAFEKAFPIGGPHE